MHRIPGIPRASCHRRLPWLLALCGFCALLLQSLVFAYEAPLSPASIHDAYTLGQRNDAATAAFFTPYLKELSAQGVIGPRIAQIELLTPFAQVVDESRRQNSGFSEQQAVQGYHRRGDTIVFRVTLMLPAAYPKPQGGSTPQPSPQASNALRADNFWQNFKFAMKQGGKPITPNSIHNQPIYSAPSKDAPSVLDGQTVWLEYGAKTVTSEPVEVDVITPDAKTISATFDLKKLR